MSALNRALTAAFDLLLRPLQLLSPVAGVGVAALATAVIVVLVMRATSNPRAIRGARAGMYAAILEMRLFNDDLRAILRAQLALLGSNAAYLRASFVPILWLMLPLGLLIVQLDAYYGRAAVSPGQLVLVKAVIRDDSSPMQDPRATLATSAGARIDIPGIWFPETHEVLWSLSPQAPGEYDLRLRVGTEEMIKTLAVSNQVVRASPARVAAGFFDQLRYPSEQPLPGRSIVKAIIVSYPERALDVFGWQIHWTFVYGLLSILFALALALAFRVTV